MCCIVELKQEKGEDPSKKWQPAPKQKHLLQHSQAALQ